ncbi:MAG: hypothetical protein ACI8TQ_000323 [Planctomycetota bacterium]|jgi:hypothetical protein
MQDSKGNPRRVGFAIWIWVLVGFVGVQVTREAFFVESPQASPRALSELTTRPPNLVTSSARELRRLPAIGKHRAVQVTRARWEHDAESGALLLGDLPGIGPITESRVQAALDRSSAASSSLEIVPATSMR